MTTSDRVKFTGEPSTQYFPRLGDVGTITSAAPDGSEYIVLFDRFAKGVWFHADSDGPGWASNCHSVKCAARDLEIVS